MLRIPALHRRAKLASSICQNSGAHNASGPEPKTIVLRIYEADGGHADVELKLVDLNSVNVEEAIPIANLLAAVGEAMPIPHLKSAKRLQSTMGLT